MSGERGLSVTIPVMASILIGYARCSTDKQDLEANRQILLELGVTAEHIYLDKAYSGTNRNRPGLDQALAAVRAGDTLVTPKLDRLARSVPDAREIGDSLAARNSPKPRESSRVVHRSCRQPGRHTYSSSMPPRNTPSPNWLSCSKSHAPRCTASSTVTAPVPPATSCTVHGGS